MAVYVVNLVIDQGADFTQTFNLEDDATASAVGFDWIYWCSTTT